MHHSKFLSCCVALALFAPPALCESGAKIVRGTEPTSTDKRFDPVCAITINETTWTGGYFGSGVLIAPKVVLSAYHVISGVSDRPLAVSFRRKTDNSVGSIYPGGPSSLHTVEVESFVRNPKSDFVLLYLKDKVSHIEPMPYDVNTFGLSYGEDAYIAGWGYESDVLYSPSTNRRLLYASSPRQRIWPGSKEFNQYWFLLDPYSSGGGSCPTCPSGLNLFDSGAPIMRLDNGKPTVVGTVTGGGGPYNLWGGSMLSAMTAANTDDAAFLTLLGSSVSTTGTISMASARPQIFHNDAYLYTKASTAGGYSATSTSGYSLSMHNSVAAAGTLSHFDNRGQNAPLSATGVNLGSCPSGAFSTGTLGYSEFYATGSTSGISAQYTLNRYHSGGFTNADATLRSRSYCYELDTGSGSSSKAYMDFTFDWPYARLNGGLEIVVVTPPDLLPFVQVFTDLNADGTNEDNEAFTFVSGVSGPELNGDGMVELTVDVPLMEPGGRYRIKVSFSDQPNSLETYATGCPDSSTFNKSLEKIANVVITPYGPNF